MSKTVFIDVDRFKLGLQALDDTTRAPLGAARIMSNCQITDRGGIAPRNGTVLLGTEDTSGDPVKGFYNFRKSFDENELLIKTFATKMQVYSKAHTSAGWFTLKNTFTSGKDFGFVTSLVNVDNEDYVIFCNRYDPYQRWTGAVTQLNGALVGAETSVTVDTTITNEIFESQTATANSATTVTVSTATWATSQWVNLYIYFPGTGKVRKITANTGTVLTFDTLGSGPGNVAFQIRKLLFPATGTIIYNNTTIAYTGIDTNTTFQVASAHAASDNTPVALVPTEYTGLPRGNRLANSLARIIVGRVRSAKALDSGGTAQGFTSGGSYFVSKQKDPFNFDFTATRVAGEGDIVGTPYGGGEITDVQSQEDATYIFKPEYIESVSYTQDANDLASRVPLKSGVGSINRTIKGADDIYFATSDNRFTSLGRVKTKDIKPETENIGNVIKRLLDTYDMSDFNGGEWKNKLYCACRETDDSATNDLTFIWNRDTKSFEGTWNISAFGFTKWNGKFYYAESNGANVYEMFNGNADVVGTNRFPIVAEYATHFTNLTASKTYLQALNSMYFEGYIRGGSQVTFKVWKDFASDPFLTFVFSATETPLLDGSTLQSYLGAEPLGVGPLGSISEADEDGRRHFQFRVYFPFQYGNYFSVGFLSDQVDNDFELIRTGLGLKEEPMYTVSRIKSV